LVRAAGKKDQRDIAPFADLLEALIQLAVDQETATDKKIIGLAANGQIDDLIQFAHAHFVRIDQHGKFLVAGLAGSK
jgi:hypothetical protein